MKKLQTIITLIILLVSIAYCKNRQAEMQEDAENLVKLIGTRDMKASLARALSLIEKYPDQTDFYVVTASIYTSMKDDANTVKYYEKALSIDPKSSDVLYQAGFYFFSKNDCKSSLKYLEQASVEKSAYESAKIHAEVLYVLGFCSHAEKNRQNAEKYFRKFQETVGDYDYNDKSVRNMINFTAATLKAEYSETPKK
ncbi:MAG TPA: hypothetical protein PL048_03225 [Leptospiraceae bacterium]|nr:hypothetical protein [Leptospiraceae bacterium]HMZ57760.1 hypothetical protein [Leptospiraceae bacterium]HNF24807.1 hypothetical protein [Leptospiraceae bacterium]HNN06866.1 hypothetical protein [Leptospiraceae bacterium]